jgi:glutathione S-transferase
LRNKPDWFLERNPLGKVPMLEHDGKVVYESLICNDYLDDIYPEEKLTPTDPYRRARDNILVETNNKVHMYIYILYLRFYCDKT